MGCVRETPQIKKKEKKETCTGCVIEIPQRKKKKKKKKRKKTPHGMCKRNSPDKN